MIRALPHVLARIFGPPLLIAPAKLDKMLLGLHAAMIHRGSLQLELPEIEASTDSAQISSERPRGYRIDRGVATVPVHGVLVRRAGQITPDSTELQSYERVSRVLRNARHDSRVRGILLDIDSPGGEAGGVFDLASEIRGATNGKPIWAIANDDALSAAYVLASATERVWTTQTGSLGSLGVVALHADQSGFDAAEGLKYTYIYRGAHKIDAHPHGALTTEAHTAIQAEVDRLYGKLVDLVGHHRNIDPVRVRNTEAAVYFGERAQTQGLADRIGTFDEAHAALVEHTQRGTRMENPTPPASAQSQTTQQQQPPQQPATPPPASDGNVVQLRVDEARQQTRVEAREIAELCALAKHPELAAGFIGDGLTAQVVRQKLQELQATASAQRPTTAIDTSADQRDGSVVAKAREAAARRLQVMSSAHRE